LFIEALSIDEVLGSDQDAKQPRDFPNAGAAGFQVASTSGGFEFVTTHQKSDANNAKWLVIIYLPQVAMQEPGVWSNLKVAGR
jgi:hypothetical protein